MSHRTTSHLRGHRFRLRLSPRFRAKGSSAPELAVFHSRHNERSINGRIVVGL
jgi:hypothetical protein